MSLRPTLAKAGSGSSRARTPRTFAALAPDKNRQAPLASSGTPQESPVTEAPVQESPVLPVADELTRRNARAHATAEAGKPKTPSKGRPTPKRPRRHLPRAAAELYRTLPAELTQRIPEHGSRRVLGTIAAELEHRSLAELADRIARNWEHSRYRITDQEPVRDPIAVAIRLARRGLDCPDIRCEDGVHYVIIGFSKDPTNVRLFDYPTPNSEPVERQVSNITPYLTDGPTIIVLPSIKPLNPQLGEVAYGNKPTDGGWLVIEPDDYAEVMSDPVAAQYVRTYVGARELFHDGDRYCLWLTDLKSGDQSRSPILRKRIEGVQRFRAMSKAASTRQAASTPHLFRQIAQPASSYLCIPAHVSESRWYFLAARFGPDVVSSNANFVTPDADGFIFAVISSLMFITWQRTVGGRIKSDLRFNKLLVWNTFPLPPTDEDARRRVIAAGELALNARRQRPELSLADLYAPTGMPSGLLDAHQALDAEVDRLFGLKTPDASELERQDILFKRYQDLT
jgi:hypothetical protein